MELFLRSLIQLLTLLIFVRVVISWIDPRGQNQISAFIIQVTEPILGPIRRMLPTTGAFDLSPIVVLVVLSVVARVI